MTDQYEQTLTADDVAVGDSGPEVVIEEVQREDFVKYAGASGDFNPVHYDEPYAKKAGNKSVFGQGMLTAGYASHMISDWFGLENVTSFKVRFRARLFPGDSLTVNGEITDIDSHDDGATVVSEFEVTNQDGNRLITGEAEATLPPG